MRSEKPFPGAAQPEVNLPETLATPTFIGFVSTQFLGAFNDNYFKQLVLLACVNEAATTGNDRQPVALAAFALPFVLLSGFGGYLSDRFSRQRTIIWCKVAEIAIMALALGVLLIPGISQSTQLMLLIGVLAFMGGQSAVFGPSKYGSLPELFRPEQLLMVNGIVQMTTFLAIIFGVVCAGIALDYLDRSLWPGSTIAVGIAIAGTLTSTLIRRTFAANPNLPLRAENLAMPREVWELLKRRPSLLQAILVATVFWFVGGVAQPAVNTLGRVSMGLSETRASMLTAAIGIGIAAGCILVGLFASKAGATWVMRGAWGMIGTLFAISLLGSQATPPENNAGMVIMRPTHPATENAAINIKPNQLEKEGLFRTVITATPLEWALRFCMMMLGVFAGTFVVPVQVYLQQAPPASQKGRVLGVQNLFSWIGILLSAVFLGVFNFVLARFTPASELASRQHIIFTLIAIAILPIAFCYRLPATNQCVDL